MNVVNIEATSNFFARQLNSAENLVKGTMEMAIFATSEAVLSAVLEAFNFIGYSVSVGLLTSSFAAADSLNTYSASLRITAIVAAFAVSYFSQYLQGVAYKSTRHLLIDGFKTTREAVMNFRNEARFLEEMFPQTAKVCKVAFVVILFQIVPINYYTVGAALVVYLTFSSHSPLSRYDIIQISTDWQKQNPRSVKKLQKTITLAKIALPVFCILAYKSIGNLPFPYFFIAHAFPAIAIPVLTELQIQLEENK